MEDIIDFEKVHEHTPKTTDELFEIVCKRIAEIKDSLETGDNSQRELFSRSTLETEYQKFTAARLQDLARGRYSVVREAEVDQEKKPDIRVLVPTLFPVSIEIKRAAEYSGPVLVNQLKEQLVGLYLRAVESRHGIFLLFNADKDHNWEIEKGQKLNFSQLTEKLRAIAYDIAKNQSGVERLEVFGIDVTDPKAKK